MRDFNTKMKDPQFILVLFLNNRLICIIQEISTRLHVIELAAAFLNTTVLLTKITDYSPLGKHTHPQDAKQWKITETSLEQPGCRVISQYCKRSVSPNQIFV